EDAHEEVDKVGRLVNNSMGVEVEFFIHADPCIPQSCAVCSLTACKERKEKHQRTIEWTLNTVLPDSKHSLLTET
ncbi:MAG: cation diffusion facilitator family transporter, partial [Bacteroidia bacterium]